MWNPPTYKSAHQLAGNPTVQCACGRRTNADMLVDLRALDSAVRTAARLPEFACDACRTAAFRRGLISRADLLQALGAPAEVVERLS